MDYLKDTLGNRIKKYESSTTEQYFMIGLPLYARLDGRAFHTFTKGFGVPYPKTENYDLSFQILMQEVCRSLVRETNASLGYVQSDEISLGWIDVSKAPFEGRKFKLESVLASLCTSFFIKYALENKLPENVSKQNWGKIKNKVLQMTPSFDCRVFQVPNLIELANCFVWRENDAIKNSISSYANMIFSKNELNGKNSSERCMMLKESGYDWNELSIETRRGTYFKRNNKVFTNDKNEEYIRTVVENVFEHERLSKIANKVEYLFEGEPPIKVTTSKI